MNLALSVRGASALAAAGVLDAVMARSVPMPCRAVHLAGREGVREDPYGEPGQAIHSVSRATINAALLDACERVGSRVRLHFGAAFVGLDEGGSLRVELPRAGGGSAVAASRPVLVVGADGAYSAVRGAMGRWMRQNFARRFIRHGYKELHLPPRGDGGYALPSPHALHVWPRGELLLIALPNPDRSFTCTLFAPHETFDALDGEGGAAAAVAAAAAADAAADAAAAAANAPTATAAARATVAAASARQSALGGCAAATPPAPPGVTALFESLFPDAARLIPALGAQWRTNPTSALVEVRCSPWANARGTALLIGDAAHATVPFYGQGCNAALEDCLRLDEALDAARGDLPAAVRTFAAARAPEGAALCDLSMANYDDMASHTASPWHRARAALDWALARWLPRGAWAREYALVTFSRTPYDQIKRTIAAQDRALAWAAAAGALAAVSIAASVGVAAVRRR